MTFTTTKYIPNIYVTKDDALYYCTNKKGVFNIKLMASISATLGESKYLKKSNTNILATIIAVISTRALEYKV